MSELDYLKDAGCLNLNAIKKKNNAEQEDDIDGLFGSEIPKKSKQLNRGASDFQAFPATNMSPRADQDTENLLAPV